MPRGECLGRVKKFKSKECKSESGKDEVEDVKEVEEVQDKSRFLASLGMTIRLEL
jgi:hypothetical protein